MEFWIKGDMLLPQLHTIQSFRKKQTNWALVKNLSSSAVHLLSPPFKPAFFFWLVFPFVDRRFEQQRGGAAGYETTNIRNSCFHWCHSDSRIGKREKNSFKLNIRTWKGFETLATFHISIHHCNSTYMKKIRREHNRSSLRTTLKTLHLFVHV